MGKSKRLGSAIAQKLTGFLVIVWSLIMTKTNYLGPYAEFCDSKVKFGVDSGVRYLYTVM